MEPSYEITTMVVVYDRQQDAILLQHRTRSWPGWAPPGGHLEGAESLTDCARREVWEETGLTLGPLTFKSILHWAHEPTGARYMVFNYYTEQFSGELLAGTEEGEVRWVPMDQLDSLQMSDGMRERLEPMFFGGAPIEMHILRYDDQGNRKVTIHSLG